jgi:hypothetical protein
VAHSAQLVAVDDGRERTRGVKEPQWHWSAERDIVAQHRAQRHDARAAGDKEEGGPPSFSSQTKSPIGPRNSSSSPARSSEVSPPTCSPTPGKHIASCLLSAQQRVASQLAAASQERLTSLLVACERVETIA